MLGTIASVQTCNWIDGGSRDLLHKFIVSDPIILLLEEACQHFDLILKENAFLGAGAFGVVFHLQRRGDTKELALKIVKDSDNRVLLLEQEKANLEIAKAPCPDEVMGAEVLLSDRMSERIFRSDPLRQSSTRSKPSRHWHTSWRCMSRERCCSVWQALLDL